MATIRKRNKKYQVQIRKLGQKINKTFYKLDDAKRWSIFYENKINLNGEVERLDTKLKLSELLDRYLNEITPVKKGSEREAQRIKRLKKEDISNKRVCILKTKDFVEFKQRRMLNGSRTCRYDLAILHHLYNVAIKQWNYPISFNPVSNVPKPRHNPPRERRLSDNELKYILNEDFKNPHIKNIINIAIETGMRRSEILSIRPQNLTKSFLWIPDSKNGCSRKIPLSYKAKRILQNSTLPFPISVNALKLSWNRMIKRSGIKDLHFHDLRHEAISRFFEKGLSIPEVSMISGHKDVRQLMRYTHLKIDDIVKKI
jgi:integrase